MKSISEDVQRFIQGTLRKSARLILVISYVCAAQTSRPIISKIDPPNWFTRLPDSLLLVHGEHLEETKFTLRGTAAHISEQSISANGHWAFLTLVSGSAKPGSFKVVATNRFGSAFAPYRLSPRRPAAQQPKGFSSADVMYLIMPDRFANGDAKNNVVAGFRDPNDRGLPRAYHGGDLRGIQQHLDYLQQLGITTIWTTPLYDNSRNQSGQTYHGYSATDMYRVDPHFGTMADYVALAAAAHARGMKIVLDTVPNHVGPASPWADDPPTPTWLHGTPASHVKVDDDFASVTDTKASESRRHVLLDGWFADVLPDLNQEDPLVAQYLVQNAIWWIESAGLDGLRIDTFPYVPRRFWHDYNQLLHILYPKLSDVGEALHGDPHITSFFAGGRANTGSDGTFDTLLDTPFDYPMFFAIRSALTHHASMTAIAEVLREDTLYPHPERLVTFIGNHDQKRFLSQPGADVSSLRLAVGLIATMRGMPQLYYGDEIDMTGGGDPDNRKDFPGGFRSDKANAFEPAGRTPSQEAMHHWVETLLQLRLHTPALQRGSQSLLLADADTLAFTRGLDQSGNCTKTHAEDRYLIVLNNDVTSRTITLSTHSTSLSGCVHLKSVLGNEASVVTYRDVVEVKLGAQEIGVFLAQP